jgi:transcriptional regulator with XRE-family HTH domain
MPENTDVSVYDFSPIGAAIKRARTRRGISRETLAEICDVSEGYIKAIENSGKNPGFQLFRRLVTIYNISVDEYFYPDRAPEINSQRRNIINMMGEIRAEDVYLVESMVKNLTQRNASND